jgi:hypothetical protein
MHTHALMCDQRDGGDVRDVRRAWYATRLAATRSRRLVWTAALAVSHIAVRTAFVA